MFSNEKYLGLNVFLYNIKITISDVQHRVNILILQSFWKSLKLIVLYFSMTSDIAWWHTRAAPWMWRGLCDNGIEIWNCEKITLFLWWRHQMEKKSALLVICGGNSPVSGEFPSQRPVTRSFDVFFDMRLNKRLSKQSIRWWFETPSRPLWHHCNDHEKKYAGIIYSDWRRNNRSSNNMLQWTEEQPTKR